MAREGFQLRPQDVNIPGLLCCWKWRREGRCRSASLNLRSRRQVPGAFSTESQQVCGVGSCGTKAFKAVSIPSRKKQTRHALCSLSLQEVALPALPRKQNRAPFLSQMCWGYLIIPIPTEGLVVSARIDQDHRLPQRLEETHKHRRMRDDETVILPQLCS